MPQKFRLRCNYTRTSLCGDLGKIIPIIEDNSELKGAETRNWSGSAYVFQALAFRAKGGKKIE